MMQEGLEVNIVVAMGARMQMVVKVRVVIKAVGRRSEE